MNISFKWSVNNVLKLCCQSAYSKNKNNFFFALLSCFATSHCFTLLGSRRFATCVTLFTLRSPESEQTETAPQTTFTEKRGYVCDLVKFWLQDIQYGVEDSNM